VPQDGHDKQDCESRAVRRQQFSMRLSRVCIVDGAGGALTWLGIMKGAFCRRVKRDFTAA
jgi:hypothetical protein